MILTAALAIATVAYLSLGLFMWTLSVVAARPTPKVEAVSFSTNREDWRPVRDERLVA